MRNPTARSDTSRAWFDEEVSEPGGVDIIFSQAVIQDAVWIASRRVCRPVSAGCKRRLHVAPRSISGVTTPRTSGRVAGRTRISRGGRSAARARGCSIASPLGAFEADQEQGFEVVYDQAVQSVDGLRRDRLPHRILRTMCDEDPTYLWRLRSARNQLTSHRSSPLADEQPTSRRR